MTRFQNSFQKCVKTWWLSIQLGRVVAEDEISCNAQKQLVGMLNLTRIPKVSNENNEFFICQFCVTLACISVKRDYADFRFL